MNQRNGLALLLLVGLVAMAACQQAPMNRAPNSDFLWERRRQCAVQAAAVIARPEFSKQVGSIALRTWSNHYNESRDRCFVRLDYSDRDGNEAKGIPFFTYGVFDAFDGSGPALNCTDQPGANKNFCSSTSDAGESVVDCAKCQALARELMSK